jgi:type I restriction enzyme S subunit
MAEKKMKPGWKVWRFEQMATNVNVRIDNPSESGMEHYVGLEHLDPDSLRIRRWGSPSDVEAGKLFFKTGDIIFAKRRAYQRKLGVAEFDGICSAHAMVLRAKPEVVLPEFLPFFMQSDLFMNRAVEISVGSLSPTINWKTMAVQEFALPQVEVQRRIVSALLAFDALINAQYELEVQAQRTTTASVNSLLTIDSDLASAISRFSSSSRINLPEGWRMAIASDICAVNVTSGSTPREGIVDGETPYPFLRVQNLRFDGRLDFSSAKYLEQAAFSSTSKTHVLPGDVLTNIVGPPLGKVSLVPDFFPEAQINQAIVRFRPKVPVLGKYLASYLMSEFAKSWLFSRSKKTSGQRNINCSTCASLPIPIPPDDQIDEVVNKIDGFFDVLKIVEARRNRTFEIKRRVLNEMMER